MRRLIAVRGSGLRSMSFGVGRSGHLSASDADGNAGFGAPAPARLRRRLIDVLEAAFSTALQQGDLATAEELLGVMENMQARAKVSMRSDRRVGGERRLERARQDLAARKQARYRRF